MNAVVYELYLREEKHLKFMEERLDHIKEDLDEKLYTNVIAVSQEIRVLIGDINPLVPDEALFQALQINTQAYGKLMERVKKIVVGE